MNKTVSYDVSVNPAQHRFLWGMLQGNKEALFCAGVGIGKTTLLIECACLLAAKNPGVSGLIASHVLNHVRVEVVPPLIVKLKQIGLYKGRNKDDRLIFCRNGARIQYGSADRPDSLDGKGVGWALGDEIRYWPKDAHDKFTARVRNKQAQFPFEGYLTTPEMNWVYDRYGDATEVLLVQGSTQENMHNLQPNYLDKLRSRYSGRLFEQYVEGKWLVLSGAVFEEFDERLHIQGLHHIHTLPVHMGFDPGYRRPNVILFQHLERCPQHAIDDCIHVLDEISENDTPTIRLAPKMEAVFARTGWKRGIVYCDPAADGANVEVGYSSVDVLAAHRFQCAWTTDVASRFIPNGIDVIRSKLKNAKGETSLFFDSKLRDKRHERGIINAIRRSKFPELKEGRVAKDEPVKDEFKDALDSLRYPLINLFPPLNSKMIIR